tara:strand:+ start:974 stop:2026 length:1053 start_codon:yes stop_codon:yes gene_type:complete
MKYWTSFILTILIITPVLTNAQTKDREYYLDISKALGYSYGIEMTNNLIQEKFTDLSKKALMARLEFNLAHEKAIVAMENEIATKMDMGKTEFKTQILNQISTQFNLDNFSYSQANEYLKKFKTERIFGEDELYKNFVQILLRHNPRYKEIPAREYLNNYREKFTSNNHKKSKGLNLSIEYPKSWINQEGKRPNILQLIKSYDGSCSMTILIKDFIAEMGLDKSTLTKEERDYIYSDAFANEINKDVFNYDYGRDYANGMGLEAIADYSFEKTKIDGQPAMLIKASGKVKRGMVDMRVFTINYLIIYKNYMIIVGFMINSYDENLPEQKKKYELLSELISSSLIFTDKWL